MLSETLANISKSLIMVLQDHLSRRGAYPFLPFLTAQIQNPRARPNSKMHRMQLHALCITTLLLYLEESQECSSNVRS